MSTIHSIAYAPGRSEYEEPYRFNRLPLQEATLIAKHGMEGDFKAGRNPKRQLNVMSFEMVETLRAEGYKTEPGELGEQLVLKGIDVMALPRGTRLQLGDEAVIEITMVRTPCEWFQLIQSKTIAETEGRVGVMATVIESGTIRVGAEVRVLEPVAD